MLSGTTTFIKLYSYSSVISDHYPILCSVIVKTSHENILNVKIHINTIKWNELDK